MSLKNTILQTLRVPPLRGVLEGLGDSPAGRRRLNAITNSGVYENFAEGWAAARKTNPVGHEDPQEVNVHLELAALRASDYAALFWISQIHPCGAKIFDYGGSIGNLFYSYSPVLRGANDIAWTVFEIPNVVEAGRQIATERGVETNLKFINSLEAYRGEEILLISGAFHYWESSIADFLRQFGEKPEHIVINRSPAIETQPSFVTVQSRPTCAFPCRVWNADELIADFLREGFELVARWPALELSLRLPLFPKYSVPSYLGFYFRKERT